MTLITNSMPEMTLAQLESEQAAGTASKAMFDQLKEQIARTQLIVDQLASKKTPIPLLDIQVSQVAALLLQAREQPFTVPCPGILPTDVLVLTPKAVYPANYGLRSAVPRTNEILVNLQCPQLLLGASFTITWTVLVFR